MSVNRKKPIVLFIYKRPKHVINVLESINKYAPNKVYIVADGPKNEEDVEKCELARDVVQTFLEKKDIKYEKDFSECNLGGPYRIPQGLNWVFDNEDEAIVLEDDCVPSLSFFHFCEYLLDYYKLDSRVAVISGNNFQKSKLKKDSYYFSCFNHCWGWATWKSAWEKYDEFLQKWPDFKASEYLKNYFSQKKHINYWSRIFDNVYYRRKVHWDYTWTFTCWSNNFLTVIPGKNLVTNVGFDEEASNTKNSQDPKAYMPAYELDFPLNHPECVIRHFNADLYTQKNHFGPKSFYKKIVSKLSRIYK